MLLFTACDLSPAAEEKPKIPETIAISIQDLVLLILEPRRERANWGWQLTNLLEILTNRKSRKKKQKQFMPPLGAS